MQQIAEANEELVIIQRFPGSIVHFGKNSGQEINNYNLVRNIQNENFYEMFCLDGSKFYFSPQHLETIRNKTWFVDKGSIKTIYVVGEKRTKKYLYEIICTILHGEKGDEQVIKFLNGNHFDCRNENICWINKNDRVIPDRANKKLPNIPGVDRLEPNIRYVQEERSDHFIIEGHPSLKRIGKRCWKTTTSATVSTLEKYNLCMAKYNELEQLRNQPNL